MPGWYQGGCRHWPRSVQIRHAFYAPNQSNADLPSHGESTCSATLLGHSKIESMARYLAIKVDDAREIAEKIDV